MSNSETLSVLNGLIETCRDGRKGYLEAAEKVRSAGLKTLFESYARQRTQFAEELEVEVRRLGGVPYPTAGVPAGWKPVPLDVRSAVSEKNEASVISECERREDSAVGRYRNALERALPAAVRVVVDRQYLRIKEVHDRIRSLEKTAV